MNRHMWNRPDVKRILDEPCVLVVSKGQLCVIQAALMDAEMAFGTADPNTYPLVEIRSALARTEVVLMPADGDVAA